MDMRFFDAADDDDTSMLDRAMMLGFNEGEPSKKQLDRLAYLLISSSSLVTGVYDDGSPDPDYTNMPVGTFVVGQGTVNLGKGPTPAEMVTSVTVRPTSKRHGILRKMMTENLTRMKDKGAKLALLTATSAGIYGRFGFRDVVDWGPIFVPEPRRLQLKSKPAGRVEMVGLGWLYPQIPGLFHKFHEHTRGSVSRADGYYAVEMKLLGDDGEVDPKFRGAVHLDEIGEIDGYLVYWLEKGTHLTVMDLVAMNYNAEFAFWDFMASVELVEDISWEFAPADWLLPRALKDRRAIKRKTVDDGLWARVLDPKVLMERPYVCDGSFDFVVEDPVGLTKGAFSLRVQDGICEVKNCIDDKAGFPVVSVEALSAMLFGSETITDLQELGLIRGVAPRDLVGISGLFASPSRPRFATMF